MAQLTLTFLDTFQVLKENQPITQFRSSNVQGLLIFLALQTERPFARDVLATLFWPDEPEKVANNNLRQILYRLRKALGDTANDTTPYLLVTRQTVQFNPDSDFELDVRRFLQAVKQRDLETAVSLYRGGLLNGFTCDSLPFEEWLRQERESVHQLAMEAFSALAEQQEQDGRLEAAQAVIRQQLGFEPWREAAHRQLMRVLAKMGDRSGALAQYALCRQQLEDELGVEPEDETEALLADIKAGKIGRLPQAERVSPAALRFSNLPQDVTPLVGRTAELEQMRDLFLESKQRLLTIVGVGGMGKTRLSLAFASQPELYGSPQHGVAFVPLAPLNSPQQLVPAIAAALHFSLAAGEPQRSDKAQLFAYLQQKEMLLVLDNFEHLLEGAELIGELLNHAPKIRVVATSRERLHLQGEQLYPLAGLSFPEPALGQFPLEVAAVEGFTAVQLFIQTARRVLPTFQLAGAELPALLRICHLLDGLPLAVELAAGWVDMLPLAEIAAEIEQSADILETDVRNVPARHRSFRAVFDASWQRLEKAEQVAFAQLSIFQGGFTREAAQAVTGASLRLLGRLVNKSLVQVDRRRQRYQIHELLRQYGAERLGQMGERKTAVLEKQGRFYLAQLRELLPELKSAAQQEALATIELELGNIRTAWGWGIGQKAFGALSEASDALRLFYRWKGQYAASEAAAEEVSALVADPATATEQHLAVKALAWQTAVSQAKGEHPQRQQWLTRARSLLARLAEQGVDAYAVQIELLLLDGQWIANQDNQQAQTIFQQAYELATAAGDGWYRAQSLRYQGIIEYSLGRYETAEKRLQQALTLAEAAGDQRLQARILDELSQLHAQLAQFEQAERYVRQSYAIYQSFGDPLSQALGMGKLGIILVFANKLDEAVTLTRQSLALFQELGNETMLAQAHIRLGIAQVYRGEWAAGRENMGHGLALYRQMGNESLTGWALWGVGESLLALGEFEAAEAAFGESITLLQKVGRSDMVSWSVGLRGLALSFLARDEEAKTWLQRGLRMGSEVREYLAALASIGGMTLLFARRRRLVRAAELYALLRRFPFCAPNNQGWAARLAETIRPFLDELPADEAAKAVQRGEALDLWETAVVLLEELTPEEPR